MNAYGESVFTDTKPRKVYTIVVAGQKRPAIRSRNTWHDINGRFITHDQYVQDVTLTVSCANCFNAHLIQQSEYRMFGPQVCEVCKVGKMELDA